MELIGFDREGLVNYTAQQIRNVVPDGYNTLPVLSAHLEEALSRTNKCINSVRMWPIDRFDPLNSSQYCTFLYFWSNTIWRHTFCIDVPVRLFLLNKALNAIDCFYEVDLPEIFLIGHSVGIVLAKATYGNHLVLYQNSTVGKNHGVAPVLQNGVVLYPNTAVIGKCLVREGTIISQGVSVIDRDTDAKKIAFQGLDGGLIFRECTKNLLASYFRDI
jgi:serine O-acetyltransferase